MDHTSNCILALLNESAWLTLEEITKQLQAKGYHFDRKDVWYALYDLIQTNKVAHQITPEHGWRFRLHSTRTRLRELVLKNIEPRAKVSFEEVLRSATQLLPLEQNIEAVLWGVLHELHKERKIHISSSGYENWTIEEPWLAQRNH